jgi:uncharacterized protein YecT (DUF1311 family)
MDKKIVMSCLCALIVIFVIPSVIFAASFDCSKANTKTEKAICDDPILSKLDEDMAAAYTKALKTSDRDAVRKGQRKWLKEILAPCIEDKVCIKKAYDNRLRQLGEKRVWRKTIHHSIGIVEFKYEGDGNGISVRTLRDNKQLQNIPAYMTENGWIEFHDLDGDGYQDIVTHMPDHALGSPISYGRVWIFRPKDKTFVEAEDISGRGYIEKTKTHGCITLTYRRSATQRPFYIGEYWCFNKTKNEWSMKKTIPEHFPIFDYKE